MPLILIFVATIIIIATVGTLYLARCDKLNSAVWKRVANWIVFLASFACLVISLRLFVNMAIFVDEYNSSPTLVCGGGFWLMMDWLRLGFLFLLSFAAGANLIMKIK